MNEFPIKQRPKSYDNKARGIPEHIALLIVFAFVVVVAFVVEWVV